MARTESDTGGVVGEVSAAHEELEAVRERVEAVGEEDLGRVASAYRNIERLLDRNEERATGYGDFEDYLAFQEELEEFVAGLPEDLPAREAFEEVDDLLHKRRLSDDDFAEAREALAPAREYADLHDRLEAARERYLDAYRAARARERDLAEEVADLRRVRALGAVDLSAPVERLRDPIETYNGAVREAFDGFKREAGAREVFDLVETAASYPLVEVRQPPSRLREYVYGTEVGEEPIPTLLDYADYSAEKLGHYVDEPHALKRHVATNRTYLERLDAEPFVVEWPPPPASKLRWRTREYEALVGRFADERTVAALRAVRDLPRDPEEYGRLRETAYALAELSDGERDRLRSGDVERDLERARERRDRLAEALAEYPEP